MPLPLRGLRACLVFPNVALEQTAALAQNVHALGPIQPLSLLYAAAILEQAGAKVEFVDATSAGLSLEQTIERVRASEPDVLGYTLATLDFAFSIEWITAIRKAVNVPVVVGGIHMSQYPLETLSHPAIDWGVMTDAERTLPRLLEVWRAEGDLGDVPGIAYRKDGVPVMTEAAEIWEELDETPWPARHLSRLDAYWSILSKRRRFTAIMSGWGCPFSCVFCVLPEVPFRQRSATSIADEMEHCYSNHGIEEFDFFDPNFCMGRARTRAICEELIDRGLADKVIWAARARVDNVERDTLELMAKAGCTRICFGLESGDMEILARTAKPQGGAKRMRDAIGWAREFGMEVLGFFTLGHPGETLATVARTKRFILSLDLDFIQVAPIFMLPGSPMYQEWVERTGDDFWREHTLHLTELRELPFLDTELTTQELKDATLDIYRSFYFRPRQLVRGVKRVRTKTQLKRAINAARGVLGI